MFFNRDLLLQRFHKKFQLILLSARPAVGISTWARLPGLRFGWGSPADLIVASIPSSWWFSHFCYRRIALVAKSVRALQISSNVLPFDSKMASFRVTRCQRRIVMSTYL